MIHRVLHKSLNLLFTSTARHTNIFQSYGEILLVTNYLSDPSLFRGNASTTFFKTEQWHLQNTVKDSKVLQTDKI